MRKTLEEKLNTKIQKFVTDNEHKWVEYDNNSLKFRGDVIVTITKQCDDLFVFSYWLQRVSFNSIPPIYTKEFNIDVWITESNINILSSNLFKPPHRAENIFSIFKNIISIDTIKIWFPDSYQSNCLSVSNWLYSFFSKVFAEETKDKNIRIKNRFFPLVKRSIDTINFPNNIENTRDCSLMLEELLGSCDLSDSKLLPLVKRINVWESSQIVIKQQIEKQTEWLLDVIRKILDENNLTKLKAKELGNKFFWYTKNSISWPEHLMEKILSDYWQNIIFWVPKLLNTDKYIIWGFSKVQFDIILIDILSDIEIVELKRTDEYILDFDSYRKKFYPTKALSIAIGQSERYITTVLKDNNPDYTICWKTIREFIEDEIWWTIELKITRPSALIVIWTHSRIVKPYSMLTSTIKWRITEKEYVENAELAYRELRNTHKNIKITTYSELIDAAELRLITT